MTEEIRAIQVTDGSGSSPIYHCQWLMTTSNGMLFLWNGDKNRKKITKVVACYAPGTWMRFTEINDEEEEELEQEEVEEEVEGEESVLEAHKAETTTEDDPYAQEGQEEETIDTKEELKYEEVPLLKGDWEGDESCR